MLHSLHQRLSLIFVERLTDLMNANRQGTHASWVHVNSASVELMASGPRPTVPNKLRHQDNVVALRYIRLVAFAFYKLQVCQAFTLVIYMLVLTVAQPHNGYNWIHGFFSVVREKITH
jgi:hypothetical protein